jgi:hypothetical protein
LYTDGWGAYERHLAFEQRTVGKQHLQTIESKQGVGKELCNFSDSLVLEDPHSALLKSKHEPRISDVNRINAVGETRDHIVFDHGCFQAFRDKTTLQK